MGMNFRPKQTKKKRCEIGVISDTHGLVRPEVLAAFDGVNLILHAGDIGTAEVLDELQKIAPVVAVRGNNDKGMWSKSIPDCKLIRQGSVSIYMLHDVKELKTMPAAGPVQVVISGHSHRPSIQDRDGVLFVNPGSAGPRRFKLPISVARLTIRGSAVHAELTQLVEVH